MRAAHGAESGENDTALSNEQAKAIFVERAAMAAISGAVQGCTNAAEGRMPEAAKTLDELDAQGCANAAGAGDCMDAGGRATSGTVAESAGAASPEQLEQLKATAALFPDSLVDSELGEVPEGWEVKGLPDVIGFLEGPGIRNWQYTEEEDGIKFINIRCIKNGDLNLETANKLTKQEAFGKYAHFQLEVDDIVVSSSGTLGRYAFVRSEHLPLSLNTSVIRFKKIDGVSTLHYIAGYVDTHLQWELEMRASGSAQRNFGPMHLRQIKMLVPSIEVLERHSELLDSLFRQRQSNLKENDKLGEIRNSLLPRLLSGEVMADSIV